MIQAVVMLIALLVCIVLIKELSKTLKKQGYDSAADSVCDLETQLSEKTDEIINQSKNRIVEFISPEKLDVFIENQIGKISGSISSKKFNEEYSYLISEDDNHPFQISSEIASKAEMIASREKNKEEKAKAIFDWFQANFPYDHIQREKIENRTRTVYRHSKEVWADKKGVCGELAVLLVVMLRHVGIKARYVEVKIDQSGKKVNHACVYAYLEKRNVLIDPAYYTFSARHQGYKVLSDTEAVPHFKGMR